MGELFNLIFENTKDLNRVVSFCNSNKLNDKFKAMSTLILEDGLFNDIANSFGENVGPIIVALLKDDQKTLQEKGFK
jgi:hypothetical protein